MFCKQNKTKQNPKSQTDKKYPLSVLPLVRLCNKIYIQIIRKMKNYIICLVNRVPESQTGFITEGSARSFRVKLCFSFGAVSTMGLAHLSSFSCQGLLSSQRFQNQTFTFEIQNVDFYQKNLKLVFNFTRTEDNIFFQITVCLELNFHIRLLTFQLFATVKYLALCINISFGLSSGTVSLFSFKRKRISISRQPEGYLHGQITMRQVGVWIYSMLPTPPNGFSLWYM